MEKINKSVSYQPNDQLLFTSSQSLNNKSRDEEYNSFSPIYIVPENTNIVTSNEDAYESCQSPNIVHKVPVIKDQISRSTIWKPLVMQPGQYSNAGQKVFTTTCQSSNFGLTSSSMNQRKELPATYISGSESDESFNGGVNNFHNKSKKFSRKSSTYSMPVVDGHPTLLYLSNTGDLSDAEIRNAPLSNFVSLNDGRTTYLKQKASKTTTHMHEMDFSVYPPSSSAIEQKRRQLDKQEAQLKARREYLDEQERIVIHKQWEALSEREKILNQIEHDQQLQTKELNDRLKSIAEINNDTRNLRFNKQSSENNKSGGSGILPPAYSSIGEEMMQDVNPPSLVNINLPTQDSRVYAPKYGLGNKEDTGSIKRELKNNTNYNFGEKLPSIEPSKIIRTYSRALKRQSSFNTNVQFVSTSSSNQILDPDIQRNNISPSYSSPIFVNSKQAIQHIDCSDSSFNVISSDSSTVIKQSSDTKNNGKILVPLTSSKSSDNVAILSRRGITITSSTSTKSMDDKVNIESELQVPKDLNVISNLYQNSTQKYVCVPKNFGVNQSNNSLLQAPTSTSQVPVFIVANQNSSDIKNTANLAMNFTNSNNIIDNNEEFGSLIESYEITEVDPRVIQQAPPMSSEWENNKVQFSEVESYNTSDASVSTNENINNYILQDRNSTPLVENPMCDIDITGEHTETENISTDLSNFEESQIQNSIFKEVIDSVDAPIGSLVKREAIEPAVEEKPMNLEDLNENSLCSPLSGYDEDLPENCEPPFFVSEASTTTENNNCTLQIENNDLDKNTGSVKSRGGRPLKLKDWWPEMLQDNPEVSSSENSPAPPSEIPLVPVKRRPGRPRKIVIPVEIENTAFKEEQILLENNKTMKRMNDDLDIEDIEPVKKRKRGRPRKNFVNENPLISTSAMQGKIISTNCLRKMNRGINLTSEDCNDDINTIETDPEFTNPHNNNSTQIIPDTSFDYRDSFELDNSPACHIEENMDPDLLIEQKLFITNGLNEIEFVCGKCDENFENFELFAMHIYRAHCGLARLKNQSQDFDVETGVKQIRIAAKVLMNINEQIKMTCEKCKKDFKSALGFEYHYKNKVCSSESKFQCKYPNCNYKGSHSKSGSRRKSSRKNLDTSTNSDDELIPATDSHCAEESVDANLKKFFLTKPALQLNNDELIDKFKENLEKNKSAECINDECEQMFTECKKLKNHLKSCIKSLRNYFCSLCRHKTISEQDMVAHISAEHPKFLEKNDSTDEDKEDIRDTKIKSYARYNHHCQGYRLARNMTLNFRNENYSKSPLFLHMRASKSNWIAMEDSEAVEYLPIVQNSPYFKFSYVNSAEQSVWESLARFEGRTTQNSKMIFAGGPIQAIAWCPLTDEEPVTEHYLAVCCQGDPSVDYPMVKSKEHEGLIQIWKLNLYEPSSDPEFYFGIAHNYGVSWALTWCPSGIYEDNLEGRDDDFERLGLLASSFSDGSIRIFTVPKNLKCKGSIFKAAPTLSLLSYDFDDKKYQCTNVSWSSSNGHNLIAGSFSNGIVSIWDIETETSFLKHIDDQGNNIIFPKLNIKAHQGACLTVSFCPSTNGNHIITGGNDRNTKFWDLRTPDHPIAVVRKGITSSTSWITHWPGAVIAFEDVFSLGKTCTTFRENGFYGQNHRTISCTNATVFSISTSDWHNGIIQADEAGEVILSLQTSLSCETSNDKSANRKRIPLYSTKLKNFLTEEEVNLVEEYSSNIIDDDDDTTEENIKPNVKKIALIHDLSNKPNKLTVFPRNYSDIVQRYGVCFKDEDATGILTCPSRLARWNSRQMDPGPLTIYPLMGATSVSWNNNQYASTWIAVGMKSGICRISKLSFLEDFNR